MSRYTLLARLRRLHACPASVEPGFIQQPGSHSYRTFICQGCGADVLLHTAHTEPEAPAAPWRGDQAEARWRAAGGAPRPPSAPQPVVRPTRQFDLPEHRDWERKPHE